MAPPEPETSESSGKSRSTSQSTQNPSSHRRCPPKLYIQLESSDDPQRSIAMAPTMFTPPPASLPPASLPPPRAPPQSMIDRTQRFLEEHWVPLLLGAGVLAAGGVYYYSQHNDRSGPSSGEKKDRKERGKGKKRRSGQGRNFSGEGNEGPLLEELPEEVSHFIRR